MKAKYLFIAIALVSVLGACSREEENLFDKSAAERAQYAMDNANAVLVAPANGWEMLYFANPYSRGYNVLVNFGKNGRLIATAKNGTTTGGVLRTDSSSTWMVKNDYGPILTMDTYNEVFHAWSDPRDDGEGLQGDYEFLILHADANFVKLKGKKYGAYYYLYPLEAGVKAADYYTEVDALQTKLCANGNLFHLNAGGKEHLLYDGNTGIFTLTETGEIPNPEVADIYPFAVRRNGIQLSFPFLDLKDVMYELKGDVLSAASSTLAPAAPVTYFAEYIELVGGAWTYNISDINETTKNAIADVNAALKKAYSSNKKAAVKSLSLSAGVEHAVLTLSYLGNSSSKTTDMTYLFSFKVQGNSLQLNYVGPSDENAEKVLVAFPSLLPMFQSLCGSFAITTESAINPTAGVKMTENSNSAKWFNLTGKQQ